MFRNRRTALLVSAAVLGGAMSMTACQGSDSNSKSGAAQGSSPVAPPAAPPAAAAPGGNTGGSAGGSAGGSGSAGATEPAGKVSSGKDSAGKSAGGQGATTGGGGGGAGGDGSIGKCRTDDLRATAQDATIGGDDALTVAVTFENIGHNCTMSGFAGVDLQTAKGPLSAKRVGDPAAPFTLKSGTSVSFGVTYPSGATGPYGVKITGLEVTPPGETKTITLNWPGTPTLPVIDGAGSPVDVGPIGSAGQGG
ncbi:hypothetical protein B4N89_42170 [Embleya scabrispora]|uniref:DUF4232 domain-containing protein n=1 Tax=Embleya scabrispora TaxID=159449 RepID=A0A1T3NK96_9ACTN|nr:DUF4232 domain-containing protein [Embleya scabrispora]OPC77168.1 hypothetical protein B4N89_42170 [Embleya scabrispora]